MFFISYKLSGKQACFTKFHSNISSLSYFFPTPTALAGITAGLLDIERDTYYETLTGEYKWAVEVLSEPRKIFVFVNYLNLKQNWMLNLVKNSEHTQIPVEFIFPKNWEGNLEYRVYLKIDESFVEKLSNLINEKIDYSLDGVKYLAEKIEKSNFVPYLGMAMCVGKVDEICYGQLEERDEIEIGFNMVLSDKEIVKKFLDNIKKNLTGLNLSKDLVPVVFDKNRNLIKSKEVVVNLSGEILKMKLEKKGFVVKNCNLEKLNGKGLLFI